eukprot:CAMPEP_0172558812 /NCGR_PEP_ID=MMETSP1067-20121228/81013_1 /TAXON_ID=265564 ORGANISM="Thalassiosira punctigera, Strain Tpunct2005C2" /NCGR_SAMPLE_ID=MMETSP1067 /ASSEMBLY_ACC=CAM_ASM_000444 /LENGTH=409 /DNA_ID=CAMNT_0013348257 /DNA_START=71 /DNA_END=1297 /DNA_ORIENTATION=+
MKLTAVACKKLLAISSVLCLNRGGFVIGGPADSDGDGIFEGGKEETIHKDIAESGHGSGGERGVSAVVEPSLHRQLQSCFADKATLKTAITDYFAQNCTVTGGTCQVGTDYGYPMNDWCTSNVRDFTDLFKDMTTFNEDINGWDTSSVTTLKNTFFNNEAFNQDLNGWDTSAVTSIERVFYTCRSFNRDLSNWDMSSVTNVYNAFGNCNVFNGDISTWDMSGVTSAEGMFKNAFQFNQNITVWDVSSLVTVASMFNKATLFNQDLCAWDISAATMRIDFFNGASAFNQNLCAWRNKWAYGVGAVGFTFTNSACPYKGNPSNDGRGPFCGSQCSETSTCSVDGAVTLGWATNSPTKSPTSSPTNVQDLFQIVFTGLDANFTSSSDTELSLVYDIGKNPPSDGSATGRYKT